MDQVWSDKVRGENIQETIKVAMNQINKGNFEEIIELEEEQNYSSGFHSYRSGERFINESRYSQLKESIITEEDAETNNSGLNNTEKQIFSSEFVSELEEDGKKSQNDRNSLTMLYDMDSNYQSKENSTQKEFTETPKDSDDSEFESKISKPENQSGVTVKLEEPGIDGNSDVESQRMSEEESDPVWRPGYIASQNTPLMNKSESNMCIILCTIEPRYGYNSCNINID